MNPGCEAHALSSRIVVVLEKEDPTLSHVAVMGSS